MVNDLQNMWAELGVDTELHEHLINNISVLHNKTHLSQNNRPQSMKLFDEALHNSHSKRIEELYKFKKNSGKIIGTFCIYVPDEIALAVGVLPIPLCGGSGFSVTYADKMLPRDICPLIRSTFGMAFSNTCPYKKLKDFAIGETTCDAKKKAWDLFGFKVLEVPQKKNQIDKELWLKEVYYFKELMENLSGEKITSENLKPAIKIVNDKRRILQRIDEFRRLPDPPINGLDALLISQLALGMDIRKFIEIGQILVDELRERTNKNISAYDRKGKRILIAGSPSPLGNAKVHYIVESLGLRIVADESCTGLRYFSNLVDETETDLNEMLKAISDRYFSIDCACFSPNKERIANILSTVKKYNIDAVVQNILQYCHGYNIEAKIVELELKKIGISSIKIETDYSEEDTEQIRTRIEAFAEMLGK